jgi:hypothetical protein
MTWVAVAIAGSAIVGSVISSDASRSAANTQSDAARNAQQTQLQMFNQTQGNLAPFLQGGQQGQNALLQYLGIGPGGSFNPNAPGVAPFGTANFQQDPSYQWRFGQGQQAVMANAAARGGIQSGQTLKDLTSFGQGLASTEYQNAFNRYQTQQNAVYNRLANLAGSGQNAAVQQGGFGQSTANNISGLQQAQGAFNAANAIGQAGAINQGIGGLTLAGILAQQQGGGGGFGQYIPGTQQYNLYNDQLAYMNNQAVPAAFTGY